MPQGHAAAPKNRQWPPNQRKSHRNKKPGKCRAFQFIGNFILLNITNCASAVNTAFVKMASI